MVKNKIITTVMLGLMVIVVVLFRSVAPKERATETQQIVETNEVSPAPQAEKVISNDDGSVIVHDQGASFKIR